jgi:DNA-binding NtrC family response regulator
MNQISALLGHVLVTGAGPSERDGLSTALEPDDAYQVTWAATAEAVLAVLGRSLPQVIVVVLGEADRQRPLDGIARILPAHLPLVPVVAVLPDGAAPDDVQRLSELADVLLPPFRALEVRGRLRRLLDRERARRRAETSARVAESLGLDTLAGVAPAFVGVKSKLPVIARSDATVLVSGETGTGKEMMARAVHYLSPRARGPFLPVDCGAIPVDLFENELFGHRRGAFTDARSNEAGLVAEAEGGTLFFDEVDTIPLAGQTKLLRFLQSQTYRPLGSATVRRADVRIIAATNADLEAAVAAGAFRKDLYYRLNIIPLWLPPLRERRGDVPLLARHFLDKWAPAEGRQRWSFATEALEDLAAYDWPGNVRELENLVHQIVATAPPGAIGSDLLPPRIAQSPASPAARGFREAKAEAVAMFERDYAARLLAECAGNVTRAARAAGQDRRVFGRLVKKYGIKASGSGDGGEMIPPRASGVPPIAARLR